MVTQGLMIGQKVLRRGSSEGRGEGEHEVRDGYGRKEVNGDRLGSSSHSNEDESRAAK